MHVHFYFFNVFETDHPCQVAEAALAHKVRNQIEVAYRRTDLFERRRRLMGDWAAYLAGELGGPGIVNAHVRRT